MTTKPYLNRSFGIRPRMDLIAFGFHSGFRAVRDSSMPELFPTNDIGALSPLRDLDAWRPTALREQ